MGAVAEATAEAWREQRKAAGVEDDEAEDRSGPFSNLLHSSRLDEEELCPTPL